MSRAAIFCIRLTVLPDTLLGESIKKRIARSQASKRQEHEPNEWLAVIIKVLTTFYLSS